MNPHRHTYQEVLGAVITLRRPVLFGGAAVEANKILAKCTPMLCDSCNGTGAIAGVRKKRKCRRCHGEPKGYSYAGAHFWVGWPPQESRAAMGLGKPEATA